MKIAKLIAVPAATIALSLATVTTFTGCEDVIGTSDTVSLENLGVPYIDSVEVLSATSAKIHIYGSFQDSEDFEGFAILKGRATGEKTDTGLVLDTIVIPDDDANWTDKTGKKGWTGKLTHTVDIADLDVDQTWYVSAFDDKRKMGQSIPAHFFGRVSTDDQVIKEYYSMSLSADTTGLDLDNEPMRKVVEDGIHLGSNKAQYATNTGADIIIEARKYDTPTSGLALTPVGGAVLFKVEASTQLTETEVADIYNASYKNEITENAAESGFITFAKGKSIRETMTSGTYQLLVGDEFFVITSALDVARLKVTSITAAANNYDITFDVTKDSGKNGGLQLRSVK